MIYLPYEKQVENTGYHKSLILSRETSWAPTETNSLALWHDFGEEKVRASRTEGFLVQINVLLGILLNYLYIKYNVL